MKIFLIGMGMGNLATRTEAARQAFALARVCLGSERLLDCLGADSFAGEKIPLALPGEIAAAIDAHPEWESAAVLLSGDVGFYSGAKKLRELLSHHDLESVPGISTPQYFAARLGRSWQDFRLVSSHGVDCDVVAEVLNHPCVFFLTGGQIGVAELLRFLNEAGLGEAQAMVGENLSRDDERISSGTTAELAGQDYSPLAVALIENRQTFQRETFAAGIPDAEFVRGDAPMTKREVRAVAMSLLCPAPDAVLWDIGAGTGSVAVEMALLARRGRVFAIEQNADNLPLIRANRERFGVYNIRVVSGRAPEICSDLPAPDAAFIGGSTGSMHAIVAELLKKNPGVRIVASAISLETLSAAMAAFKEFSLADREVTQVAVSRARLLGGNHLMTALNPIFLISGRGGK